MYQTPERVFPLISKHLEIRQKYSTARRIFSSLLRVWKSEETLVSLSCLIYFFQGHQGVPFTRGATLTVPLHTGGCVQMGTGEFSEKRIGHNAVK